MEIVTQLAVFLANEPGTLADVCDELANADINIFALTISDTVDHSVVRMVVSDPVKALSIFEERSVLVVENDVLMIENSNRRGVLGAIARCLAEAGVNIEYAYLASSPKSETGLLILRPSDLHRAFDILNDRSAHK